MLLQWLNNILTWYRRTFIVRKKKDGNPTIWYQEKGHFSLDSKEFDDEISIYWVYDSIISSAVGKKPLRIGDVLCIPAYKEAKKKDDEQKPIAYYWYVITTVSPINDVTKWSNALLLKYTETGDYPFKKD